MLTSFFAEKKMLTLALVAISSWLLVMAVYVFQIGGLAGVAWVGDLYSILVASAVTTLSFMVWQNSTPGELARRVWVLFTLGFALWTLGEAIWGFYELLLGEEIPYPSLADVAWLSAYIPLAIALFIRYRSLKVSPESSEWRRIILFYLLVFAILFVVLLLPILSYPEYDSPVEQALDALYPLSELLLLYFVLLLVVALRGGHLAFPWMILAVGFMISVMAESMFSYGTWNEIYFPEGGINSFTIAADAIYFLSYLVLGMGIFGELQLSKSN